jgi:hypothetical protein
VICDQRLFENLAVRSQQSALSNQPEGRYLVFGTWYLVKQCDPLPIDASAEGYKSKKIGKMTPIRLAKTTEKWPRQPFDSPFELHFSFCFQQKAMGGGVAG